MKAGGHPRLRRADEVIDPLAAVQHGVVTRRQLIAAGMSPHVIARLTRRGRLRAVHAGVYTVGPVVPPLQWAMAAMLTCDGVLSGGSAGRLWRMPTGPAETIEVIVPRSHRSRRPGITARCIRLAPDEVTAVEGIRVTTPSRTILDLAATAAPRQLERALAFSEREGLVASGEIMQLLRRHVSARGTRRLRDLLASGDAPAFTRSEAEERLLHLVRSGGLPAPEMNVVVHGREVDCFWRQAGLIVEVDGYAFHGSARAFVRDRQRDSALAAAGLRVLRLSWQQVTTERDRTLVQLAQALVREIR